MKLVLSLAALAAVLIAFQNANAVEEPPEPRVQLVEIEQQTPYLESFNSITAGTATQSAIRRVGNTGGVVFSSQAYALFDNQNPDGSRATFPLEVEDAGTYGLRAQFVKGPDMGVVQVAVDGRPLGAPIDLYASALQVAQPAALGVLALAEGKHMFTLEVTSKNEASSNYRAGIDLLVLDTQAAPQATPTAVATAEVGGSVPPTLALTVGPDSFGAFHPGVAREYTAVAAANVISSAGDAALTVSEPGRLANGSRTLAQPLRVDIAPATWSDPVSNAPVTVTFKQAIGADEPLRTGSYSRTLTFTLSTTNP
jgi:hypothetical protein